MKIINYIDSTIETLKTELLILNEEFNVLFQCKNDYLNKIDVFNMEYHKFLGSTIEEILKLKVELAKELFKRNKITEDELFLEKQEYYSFKQILFDEEPYSLEEDEEKELKKIYRQASKLTHPDIVSDFFKEEASEIFVLLNGAYKRKDLEEVKRILKRLENNMNFSIDNDSKENFLKKINIVKDKINYLKKEILDLESSIVFKIIQEGSITTYLETTQYKLNQIKLKIENDIKKYKR